MLGISIAFHRGYDRFYNIQIIQLVVQVKKSYTLENSFFDQKRTLLIQVSPFIDHEHILGLITVFPQNFLYPEVVLRCRFLSYTGTCASLQAVIKTTAFPFFQTRQEPAQIMFFDDFLQTFACLLLMD